MVRAIRPSLINVTIVFIPEVMGFGVSCKFGLGSYGQNCDIIAAPQPSLSRHHVYQISNSKACAAGTFCIKIELFSEDGCAL